MITSDHIALIALFFSGSVAVFGFEHLARKSVISQPAARKFLFLIAASITSFSVYLIESINLLIITASGASVLAWLVIVKNLFSDYYESQKQGWSIFYFSLAFLFLLVIFRENRFMIFFPFFSAGISKGISSITGLYLGRKHYVITAGEKSIAGSISFFLLLFLFTLAPFYFNISETGFSSPGSQYLIISSVTIAFFLTVTELLTSGGNGSFFVPVLYAVLFFLFYKIENFTLLYDFLTGLGFAFLLVTASYKLKFLSLNGSIATFILAGLLFGFGGWAWSVPILSFFLLSSLISKMPHRSKDTEGIFEKSSTRDYLQVFANGGAGGVLVLLYTNSGDQIYYLLYVAALAAVCADTWATEIGTMRKTATYHILNFRKVSQGISGGISVQGTLGAVAGSFAIALSGAFWINEGLAVYFLLVMFSGLAGSIIDSLLGATIQLQYKCNSCGKITERKEHCGVKSKYFRGINWVNNDVVNFLCSLSGIVIILIFASIV